MGSAGRLTGRLRAPHRGSQGGSGLLTGTHRGGSGLLTELTGGALDSSHGLTGGFTGSLWLSHRGSQGGSGLLTEAPPPPLSCACTGRYDRACKSFWDHDIRHPSLVHSLLASMCRQNAPRVRSLVKNTLSWPSPDMSSIGFHAEPGTTWDHKKITLRPRHITRRHAESPEITGRLLGETCSPPSPATRFHADPGTYWGHRKITR